MSEETQTPDQAEALWNEVAQERAAAEAPASELSEPKPSESTVTPEVTPADTAAEVGDKPAEAAAEQTGEKPDPYAGLSPELKARLQRLEQAEEQLALVPQLQQHVRRAEGRVAAMQRELDVAKNAAKAVGNAPTQAQIAAASGNTQKWDALKSDFPEWAEATAEFVAAKLAGINPGQTAGLTPDEVRSLVSQQVAQTRQEALKAIEEAKVEGKHEDWLQVIQSPDFDTWFKSQDDEIKKLAHSPKGRDAIRMLDLFKAAKAAPAEVVQEQRKNKLAAAVSAKPGSASTARKTLDQMTPQELWNYEAQRAANRGREQGLTY